MHDRFVIRLWDTPPQWTGFALQEKDGAYLSATGRMAARSKAVAFGNRRVVDLCVSLWMPRLTNRYGADFRMAVEHWTSFQRITDQDLRDAATLLAKARVGRWASNQAVSPEAIAAALAEISVMV